MTETDEKATKSRTQWLMKWDARMRKAHGFPAGHESWLAYLIADEGFKIDKEAEPKALALAITLAAKIEHEMGRDDTYDYKAVTDMLEVLRA